MSPTRKPDGAPDPEDLAAWLRGLAELARVVGPGAWLTAVQDHRLWHSLPKSAQEQVASGLAANLAPRFKVLGVDEFRCGALSHRLITIREVQTRPARPLLPRHEYEWLFRLIPGGVYRVGSPHHVPGLRSLPERSVQVRPFLVGVTPVSQGMWLDTGEVNRCYFKSPRNPVESISQVQACEWIAKLGGAFSLPSEAQWEIMARGGSNQDYFFGDDPSLGPRFANVRESELHRCEPVASREPNAYGIYDTIGNVAEWCLDLWEEEPDGAPADDQARLNTKSKFLRVKRGGGWFDSLNVGRSAYRSYAPDRYRQNFIGFRLIWLLGASLAL